MGDIFRQKISFTEFFNFQVFKCNKEEFVQKFAFLHFQKRFDSPPPIFSEDFIMSDNNGFTYKNAITPSRPNRMKIYVLLQN